MKRKELCEKYEEIRWKYVDLGGKYEEMCGKYAGKNSKHSILYWLRKQQEQGMSRRI